MIVDNHLGLAIIAASNPMNKAPSALYVAAATFFALCLGCRNTPQSLGLAEARLRMQQPVEPIAVYPADENGRVSRSNLLNVLQNETMFVSIAQLNSTGGLTYATAGISEKLGRYNVTVDYVKFLNNPLPITTTTTITTFPDTNNAAGGSEPITETNITHTMVTFRYGVGLRVTASFVTFEKGVNLSGLYGLGLAAQQNKLSGTLMIETLGISGKGISPLIPMPSEINISTIQAAIQAIASIKAKMYEQSDDIQVSPQIISVNPGNLSLDDAIEQIMEDAKDAPARFAASHNPEPDRLGLGRFSLQGTNSPSVRGARARSDPAVKP